MNTILIRGNGESSVFEILDGRISGAVCGGKGFCGKCRIQFVGVCPEASTHEKEFLSSQEIKAGIRLACYCYPNGSFSIYNPALYQVGIRQSLAQGRVQSTPSKTSLPIEKLSPNSAPYHALMDFSPISLNQSKNDKGYGFAIDLGTTTIAMALVDLCSGAVLAKTSFKNPQIYFGADVLSRIEHACVKKNGEVLQKQVLEKILKEIFVIGRAEKIDFCSIKKIKIVANTTMCHLVLALPVCGLGYYPFTPHTLFFTSVPVLDVVSLLEEAPFSLRDLVNVPAIIEVLPCLDAFIGSDVLAGLVAYAGSGEVVGTDAGSEFPALYIDLGTNAELALITKNEVWCSSAAAGPAFEGAHISCGCGSIAGAISAVWLEGSRFVYEQIPAQPALSTDAIAGEHIPGVCGTGLIDLLACALDLGLVLPSGSLAPACEDSGIVLDKKRGLRLGAQDIRELQLAIAAVKTGIAILLQKATICACDIKKVYIAGGFGFYLNEKNAIRVGLIHEDFRGKTVPLGNAALGACIEFLKNDSLLNDLVEVQKKCRLVSLAEEQGFNDEYIRAMDFPTHL